jgi:hypothetical protein
MDILARNRVNAYESTFNVDVDEMNEEWPKAEPPQGINITLKDHQLTLFKRCQEYETKDIYLSTFNNIKDVVTPYDHFKTRIGIIGDRVGSGKSYVILSLIKSGSLSEEERVVIRSTALNHVVFYVKEPKQVLMTNVIVIPFSLCAQWENYIRNFGGNMKYKVINKARSLAQLMSSSTMKAAIQDEHIVLITSTFYNRFCEHCKREKIIFSRVFFDEADNININSCSPIDATFIWFVTASYANFLYPKGFVKQDMVGNSSKLVWYAEGLRNTGFIKNVFADTNYTIPQCLLKTLVVKNSEAYVQKSIALPPMNTYIVRCKTPASICVLNGIVDKNIMTALNAGDVQRAIQYISPNQKMDEENIVRVIISKYITLLSNLDVRLRMMDEMQFMDIHEKERELQAIMKQKADLTQKIDLIKERIQNTMCCICYDDPENKTIVKCCQNSFCFKCISKWLVSKANCPYCKAHLTTSELLILSNEAGPSNSEKSVNIEEIGDVSGFSKSYSKLQNLGVLLEAKKHGKTLIFSCSDTSFVKLTPILDRNGIRYDYLKGTGSHINNVMEKYKNGNVNVLLVNVRYYGSGFNMENTTDVIMFHKFDTEIEKQVVGRAQRYGRTKELNVWYLMYENE